MKSVIAVSFIVISGFIAYFYVRPQWDEISILKNRNSELMNTLAKSKELIKLKDELKSELSKIPEEEAKKIDRVVPNKYEPIKLVADINVLALRHNMFINDVDISDSTDSSGQHALLQSTPSEELFKKREVSFSAKGRYSDFVEFIGGLEDSLQILDITKIDIATASENGKQQSGAGVLNFKISLDSYWLN